MAGAAVTVAYGAGHRLRPRRARRPTCRTSSSASAPSARRGRSIVARACRTSPRARTALEVTAVGVGGRRRDRTRARGARRRAGAGYAIVDGRDVDGRGRRGRHRARRGQRVARRRRRPTSTVGRLGSVRVVGIAVAPDNVAFPLASAPRDVRLGRVARARRSSGASPVNQALIWAARPGPRRRAPAAGARHEHPDRGRALPHARGVRVLIDSAAGIVIALLIAFSLVALAAAGDMLAAAARGRRPAPPADDRHPARDRRSRAARSRPSTGSRPRSSALAAGAIGLTAGALAAARPSRRLLEALNEQPPGCGAAACRSAGRRAGDRARSSAAAAAWPAWRATARPTVALLRGAEVASRPAACASRRRLRGARRPARAGAPRARRRRASPSSRCSAAVVLLMLGLASLVAALRDDPGSVGKRYDLTARLPAERAARACARCPASPTPRRATWCSGADSFALGEPVKLLAFPGDHTRFEDPPLAAGRRAARQRRGRGRRRPRAGARHRPSARRSPSSCRAAARRASASSGPSARSTTTAASPTCARRACWPPTRAPRRRSWSSSTRGADRAAVDARLRDARRAARRGRRRDDAQRRLPRHAGRAAARRRRSSTRSSASTRWSRASASWPASARPTLALLRATGAEGGTVGAVLAGAALAVALPAALLALALERLVLAPLVGHLAAGYADLGPRSASGQAALVARRAGAARRGRGRLGRAPGDGVAAPAGAEGGVMRAAVAPGRRRCSRSRAAEAATRRPPARAGRPWSRRGRTPTATAS